MIRSVPCILLFSFFLAQENVGYQFISNFKNKDVYAIDLINDFSQGGYTYTGTFSGRQITEFIGIDQQGEYKFLQMWSDVISTNIRNDETKVNHDAQKMNGAQFYVYYDSSGTFDIIEGVDDLSREMAEEQQSWSIITGLGNSLVLPFGSDSLRNIGDTWSVKSKENFEEYPGMDDVEAEQISIDTYKFKKVKQKKKGLIAYLDIETKIEIDMFANTWDESWELNLIGQFNATIQYNLTTHEVIRIKNSGIIRGDGIDLTDDERFTFQQNISIDTRRKKG